MAQQHAMTRPHGGAAEADGDPLASVDWSTTSLGPRDGWPQSLRTMLGVVTNSPLPMMVWWGRERLQLYNGACRDFLGDEHGQSFGMPAAEIWGERWGIVGSAATRVLDGQASGSIEHFVLALNRQGGRENVWFTFTYSAIPDDSGAVGGVLVVVQETLAPPEDARDALALGELATRVRTEREHFRSLLACIPVEVNYLRGPDLVFEFAHPLTVKAAGRELEGRPLLEAIPEDKGKPYIDLLHQVLESGEPRSGKEVLVRLDRGGSTLSDTYWDFIYLPVRSLTGVVEGVMLFDVEVTDQVNARRELEVVMAKLQDGDQRKDEFLAMLAHELRNPLAPMRTTLQLIRQKLPQSSIGRELDILDRQTTNLARIVDDLLDVSRITHGTIELRKESVELSQAVSRALEATRDVMAARHHRVSVVLCEQPLAVLADPVRLEQILVNLLVNAAKYTEAGGRIDIAALGVGAQAQIRIRDNGVGMPAELRARIFGLFEQGTRDLARGQGGLGIGLTIVRNLVELHDGTVEAFSEGPGMGSEFVVHLPLISLAASAPEPRPSPLTKSVGHEPVRQRVLVVDDNDDAAETLAAFVRALGHDACTANQGVTALDIAAQWRPDIVFLDIGLPGMSGYQVARELHQAHARPPQLIALTGYGQESDRERTRAAGFAHHLVKPAVADDIVSILNS